MLRVTIVVVVIVVVVIVATAVGAAAASTVRFAHGWRMTCAWEEMLCCK